MGGGNTLAHVRTIILVAAVLFSALHGVCQRRYLVSPQDGMSPAIRFPRSSGAGAICGPEYVFGYLPVEGLPPAQPFGGYHKDILAEWFVAKASGTIDTIYWEALGSVGALDSTVWVSVRRSYIGPDFGPGVRPGPYDPPCQTWGYWLNTNDVDQGIAAFLEDATDTSWISTYQGGGGLPSTPPFGPSLLPVTEVPLVVHANHINMFVPAQTGAALTVSAGDRFVICFRIGGPSGHTTDARTEFGVTSYLVTADNEEYPSRNWKFYEHDTEPGHCAGVTTRAPYHGWTARGGFTNDTLGIAAMNFWYSMTVTSNLPPVVQDDARTSEFTLETGPRLISAVITDCNPSSPASSGIVASAIEWARDGIRQSDIPLTHLGGDYWEGTIPGSPAGAVITYHICASDSAGLIGCGAPREYEVVELGKGWYAVDTGITTDPADISATGLPLTPSDFFLPRTAPPDERASDNGTAGPIDLGSPMIFFGRDYRYIWIGVDGGVAFSEQAADTQHLNDGGHHPVGWSFTNGGAPRPATMPQAYLAPLGADLFLGDTGASCGTIRYQRGYRGDSCVFIIEWDSMGSFSSLGGPTCDVTTFRVILNECTGTIEYQYGSVGGLGVEYSAIVGLQDSNWVTAPLRQTVFVNQYGTPDVTRPRDGWQLKLYPAASWPRDRHGWKPVSTGVIPLHGDCSSGALYGVPYAFAYDPRFGYGTASCMVPEAGYWVKNPVLVPHGELIDSVTVPVITGWNFIGVPGRGPSVAEAGAPSPVYPLFPIFEYGPYGWFLVNAFHPGNAYWMKSAGPGLLHIRVGNALAKNAPATNLSELNTFTITDAAGHRQTLYMGSEPKVTEALGFYEMPPAAPEFDARYTSGRILETYPDRLDARATYEFPIAIEAGAYPVTVLWNVTDREHQLVLSAAGQNTVMNGGGRVTLRDASVKGIAIRVTEAGALPKEFALGQNYPNPFNPSTRFEIQVAKSGPVSLRIYDILGRMVTELVNEVREPGIYNVTWDADNYPTGVYFAKMTAGDFNASRKIMLMK